MASSAWAADASPIPNPPSAHATWISQYGRSDDAVTATTRMAGIITTNPMRMNATSPKAAIHLSCTQLPAVQKTVAMVTARLPTNTCGAPTAMEGVRDERLHPVEGEHQQAARRDHRRQAGSAAQRPDGRQPAQRSEPDQDASGDRGHGHDRARREAEHDEGGPGRHARRLDDAPSPEAHGRRGVGDESGQRPQGAHDERADHHDRRRQPEEHPAPSEGVRHPLGEDRADQARHDPGRRHHREQPRPLLLVEHAGDGDVRHGRDDAGAEPLDEPASDEHRHRRRQPPEQEPGRERRDAPRQRRRQPAALGQLATLDDADHRPEEERRGDPPVPRHPVEVGLDVGEDADHRQRLGRRDDGAGDEAELHRAPREPWLLLTPRCSRWFWLPARPVVASG